MGWGSASLGGGLQLLPALSPALECCLLSPISPCCLPALELKPGIFFPLCYASASETPESEAFLSILVHSLHIRVTYVVGVSNASRAEPWAWCGCSLPALCAQNKLQVRPLFPLLPKPRHLTQPAKACTFLLLKEHGGGSRETDAWETAQMTGKTWLIK